MMRINDQITFESINDKYFTNFFNKMDIFWQINQPFLQWVQPFLHRCVEFLIILKNLLFHVNKSGRKLEENKTEDDINLQKNLLNEMFLE